MPTGETVSCCKQSSMGDSSQSSKTRMLIEEQTTKTRLRRFQLRRLHCRCIPDYVCCALAENVSTSYLCSQTWQETEMKGRELINLTKEISRQLNIEAVAWVPVLASSTLRIQIKWYSLMI